MGTATDRSMERDRSQAGGCKLRAVKQGWTRRVTRRVFNVIVGMSLLMFTAGGVLSVRSHRVSDTVQALWPGRELTVRTASGSAAIYVSGWSLAPDEATVSEIKHYVDRGPLPASRLTELSIGDGRQHIDGPFLGMTVVSDRWEGGWSYVGVLPIWLASTVVALPGLIWCWRSSRSWWTRRTRLNRHCCATCGYDLRGSSGRCPECGGEFQV